jgi:serine/threonine protein kinase
MTKPQPGGEPLRRWDPERIGPYVILGRLGAGAMGQVYLGRSAAGRLVAVKTIRVELAEEAGFRTRFAQEVAAARRVSGVFTAAVVEADPDADLPWLATAYVPAPSLARLVKACGPLPLPSVSWLAAGCAEALESIHGAGLVHRDLKPSNVLVAPDGPRVIDFGVARAAERMGLAPVRHGVGTPAYMAPEQARDTHQVSPASDVYALGATLLFAATGHPPYQGDSALDVLARLATEEPDLSGLPEELTELIGACLARVPRERPTSTAMLAQLGQFAEVRSGPAEEHSYLPEAAMALITQYQRNPLLAAGRSGPEDSGDATSASYTELPASYQPKPRPKAARPRPSAGPHWRTWVRTHLAWVGWVSVGAALVVGGVILGASLSSSGSSSRQGSQPPPIPPAPQTLCPVVQAAAGPGLCMVRQSQGTASAPFTVRGNDFTPGSSVTFTVSEVDPYGKTLFSDTLPRHVTVGPDGTFQVVVGQLYAKPLVLGLVTVDASEPGGAHASTEFMIIPAGPPPGSAPSPR